ncbi:MAG: hypothetical protein O2904_05145 [bacterium]|nr:hypothetical protein [bacterium]
MRISHIYLYSLLLLTACLPTIDSKISSFEECADAGFSIMESYPEQCSDGVHSFTRDIGNADEKSDLIRLDSPRPGETVSFPLELHGEARGYWYFEATFPIVLTDETGKELVATYATAQGEWMTEDFVPFTATVEASPSGKKGELLLKHSNASGLPERDDELRVPLKFE